MKIELFFWGNKILWNKFPSSTHTHTKRISFLFFFSIRKCPKMWSFPFELRISNKKKYFSISNFSVFSTEKKKVFICLVESFGCCYCCCCCYCYYWNNSRNHSPVLIQDFFSCFFSWIHIIAIFSIDK